MEIGNYNTAHSREKYENFYTRSDFLHFGLVDRVFINTIVRKFHLENAYLLDLGCGTGWYTFLFNSFGVQALGIDLSEVAIRAATRRYSPKSYMVSNGIFSPFQKESFDALFISGFPPYNEPDLRVLNDMHITLFSLLKPGGLFFFHKTTDLSGLKGSRMNHAIDVFESYFVNLNLGIVIGTYAVSPLSWMFMQSKALSTTGRKLCTFFTKLTGIPLRALIVILKF
jgi:SAM-dependent methyltransferase